MSVWTKHFTRMTFLKIVHNKKYIGTEIHAENKISSYVKTINIENRIDGSKDNSTHRERNSSQKGLQYLEDERDAFT